MSYTVEWSEPAENELATAWVAASDRGAVASAAHDIEHRLRLDPKNTGESRSSHLSRVVLWSPLGAWFEIIEDDKKARIL